MNLFENQARGRLVAKDPNPNPKIGALRTTGQDANIDGFATRGARSEPRPVCLALDFEIFVAQPVDGEPTGGIDVGQRCFLGRAQFTGRKSDGAGSGSADQEQCPATAGCRSQRANDRNRDRAPGYSD